MVHQVVPVAPPDLVEAGAEGLQSCYREPLLNDAVLHDVLADGDQPLEDSVC